MTEAIPFLLRRPKALALLVLAVCLSLSAWVIWQLEQNQRHASRADVENSAQNHAFLVRDSLDQALTLNYSFAAMIRIGQGNTAGFDDAARELLPYFDSVSHVSLSPDGIITQVYPLAGNEKSLGFNQLEDSLQNKEAIRARDTGKLTLAGPVQLVQGGLGAVARLPVFLEAEGGQQFWGFTNVIIRVDRLLETANLNQLEQQGMAYKLWRTHPDTGAEEVIAANAPESLTDPVHKSFDVPNGSWTLSVMPVGGWINNGRLAGELLIAFILSLLLAYQSWLMVGLQRRRLSLQDAVADQTRESEERINKLAFYDPLTQLPNRSLLQERLGHAIDNSLHQQLFGALLVIDLDDFKTLNDNRGHHIGDLLLIAVAERLRNAVRKQDTVARLGGDEFLVVLEGLGSGRDEAAALAQQIAEKILNQLNNHYLLDGEDYFNSPSIGICLFGDQPVQTDELLKQADQAMYNAKDSGRNTLRFFDPEMQAATAQRFSMQNDIREALQQQQFQLYYQPQVDSAGVIVGAEALIRWLHPQRGMIPPLDFIPIAEDSGLILPMGNWIFATACTQLLIWSKTLPTAGIILSINVSARQFQQPHFVEQLLAIIERSGADPHHLKLELTESMLIANQQDVITKMDALKTHGIKFSLDDFGTGYSSLSYLKRMPISELKIDKSFVNDILTDANDAAIARMIIRLAQSMELSVIAEGVETKEQRDWLEREGCLQYQGYYFGRPVPVTAFLPLNF